MGRSAEASNRRSASVNWARTVGLVHGPYHDRERLGVPVLPGAQPLDRGRIGGVNGEVEPA